MKASSSEKLFYTMNYILLAIAGLSCLLPLIHIVSLSLSDYHAVVSGQVFLWPVRWTVDAYVTLIEGTNIVRAFQNSVVITVVGVALSMSFTIMAAYPLSRNYFFLRRFFSLAAVFTMLFNGGLIPTYLIMSNLGLVNTYAVLWLLGLVSVFNMMVLRTSFESLPPEIDEAARMDGCGEWRYLFRIVLPLSLPVLATLTLFYGVAYWNAFISVLIYINDSHRLNLTVLVQQMVQSQSLLSEVNQQSSDVMSLTPESMKSAGIIIMVLPMLIVYPFLQRYFVKGVMIGAIKS
ncbi:carbohydrate ABC transporter permease [Paenibacillus sp. 1P07SE]|uniref:carbohydrate ABC transporter permease n=1 Tax=Paenibacillus sp. 1P07SE TaxID=3132209 RepID=UPI0039A71F17